MLPAQRKKGAVVDEERSEQNVSHANSANCAPPGSQQLLERVCLLLYGKSRHVKIDATVGEMSLAGEE